MAKNKIKLGSNLGNLFYTIGVIIAVIMGIGTAIEAGWASNRWIIFVMVIIGLITGFKNIASKEVTPFLIGTIALMTATRIPFLITLDSVGFALGTFLTAALEYFIVVIGTAAIVVSFRVVYGLAK